MQGAEPPRPEGPAGLSPHLWCRRVRLVSPHATSTGFCRRVVQLVSSDLGSPQPFVSKPLAEQRRRSSQGSTPSRERPLLTRGFASSSNAGCTNVCHRVTQIRRSGTVVTRCAMDSRDDRRCVSTSDNLSTETRATLVASASCRLASIRRGAFWRVRRPLRSTVASTSLLVLTAPSGLRSSDATLRTWARGPLSGTARNTNSRRKPRPRPCPRSRSLALRRPRHTDLSHHLVPAFWGTPTSSICAA